MNDTPTSGHGRPSSGPVPENRDPDLWAWRPFISSCATAWKCWGRLVLAVATVALAACLYCLLEQVAAFLV
jgi:hypothetical protein